MWKSILVAYDGSDFANQALVQACELAKAIDGTVSALAVIKMPEPMLGLKPEIFVDDVTNYYKQHFAEAIKNCPRDIHEITLEVDVGRPVDGLLNFATKNKVDLIVIGYSKKKSLLDKLILGSVAKQVVDHASCSVLLVR